MALIFTIIMMAVTLSQANLSIVNNDCDTSEYERGNILLLFNSSVRYMYQLPVNICVIAPLYINYSKEVRKIVIYPLFIFTQLRMKDINEMHHTKSYSILHPRTCPPHEEIQPLLKE